MKQWLGAKMHNKNKLMVAAAGAGKTTYLINQAFSDDSKKVLITTYTDSNTEEIRAKIVTEKGYIPKNITILPWVSFLLQHGVRPYQSTLDDTLHEVRIGYSQVNKRSALYTKEKDCKRHYLTNDYKIYSDKLAKFVYNCNERSQNKVISRITEIFDAIYIDEVQDLAGYDLEILKLLFASKCEVLLVGDPRQTTYTTHNENKYQNYTNGKIKEFIQKELEKNLACIIDEETLCFSHRNNSHICSFSSALYPNFHETKPCECATCRQKEPDHCGVFLIDEQQINEYLEKFKPMQLRWEAKTKSCSTDYKTMNMGHSKGLSFDRVLIYPTGPIKKFIAGDTQALKDGISTAKFYVAITRARHSVAIVIDSRSFKSIKDCNGIQKYVLSST